MKNHPTTVLATRLADIVLRLTGEDVRERAIAILETELERFADERFDEGYTCGANAVSG